MPLTEGELIKVLDEYIAPRVDQIGAVFLDPDARITLIVRTPAAPNGELIVTNDELDEVRKVIDRQGAALMPAMRRTVRFQKQLGDEHGRTRESRTSDLERDA